MLMAKQGIMLTNAKYNDVNCLPILTKSNNCGKLSKYKKNYVNSLNFYAHSKIINQNSMIFY